MGTEKRRRHIADLPAQHDRVTAKCMSNKTNKIPRRARQPLGRRPAADPRTSYTIRVNLAERSVLASLAATYTGGNISAWLRFAALRFVPTSPETQTLATLYGSAP